MTTSEQKARAIVAKFRHDYFRSDIHPEDSVDQAVSAISKAIDDAVREEREAWEQAVWQYKEVWSEILESKGDDKFWDTVVNAKFNTLIGICERAERVRQRSQS
jgi:hypothetical protein